MPFCLKKSSFIYHREIADGRFAGRLEITAKGAVDVNVNLLFETILMPPYPCGQRISLPQ
jgi:hypothetical protein